MCVTHIDCLCFPSYPRHSCFFCLPTLLHSAHTHTITSSSTHYSFEPFLSVLRGCQRRLCCARPIERAYWCYLFWFSVRDTHFFASFRTLNKVSYTILTSAFAYGNLGDVLFTCSHAPCRLCFFPCHECT